MTTHSVYQKLKGLKKNKKVARSNIAFKCNYCDGGKSVSRIGFHGVCSDVILRYNIESDQHVWCTDRDCPCRNYLDGHISRAELENMMEGGAGLDSVCYESHMLRDWMASAGVVQNGPDRGKPRRLMKVQKNSLAVLTTRDPNSPEDTRYIFAVFLVDDSYEGDHKDAGYVTTFSSWKIELSPQEARKMKFWTYYANSNRDVIAFSSGLFRYLSDNQAAQILRDIKEIRATAKDREFAEHFLEYFCKINSISVTDIPAPNGALIKK